jgi:hypothetical protein
MYHDISKYDVVEMAMMTAAKLNIKIPSEKTLLRQLFKRKFIPQIYSNGITELWVDRWYIAFSNINEDEVHYVYLTLRHIYEEYKSFMQASKARKKQIKLPQQIDIAFRKALLEMANTKKTYVFNEIVDKTRVN